MHCGGNLVPLACKIRSPSRQSDIMDEFKGIYRVYLRAKPSPCVLITKSAPSALHKIRDPSLRKWRVPVGRVPSITFRHRPIAMASPQPVSVLDLFFHRLNKRRQRAQTIFLLWTSFDGRKRNNTIIHNDTNLGVLNRTAFEH